MGDFVASHVTISGTHTGELFGIPATGKDVSYPGIEIVRTPRSSRPRFWDLLDMLTMMQQIGVAPSDGPPEE
jgi:predicted ester cyclase